MTKSEVAEKVKELVNAPSCYAPLRELAESWLKAMGTPKEKVLSKKLIEELEADVQPIDDVIEFFGSEAGQKAVGAEAAAGMLAHFKEVKAAGGKWCDCPACKAGTAILDNKAVLL